MTDEFLLLDAFNFGVLFEKHLLYPNDGHALSDLRALIRGNIHNYIEFSLDYAYAGLFREAVELIQIGLDEQHGVDGYPLAYYYNAWYLDQLGEKDAAD